MPPTKGPTSLASGVTTTSTSAAVDVSDAYSASVGVKVVQVGTATTAATWTVRVSYDGGTDYYDHATAAAPFAAGTYTWTVRLPESATNVLIDFAAQSGGTSSTLDAEVGEVTAL